MQKNSRIVLEDVAEATTRDLVREFINSLLKQGMDPQKVAEELTYTAVEMSLQLAGNKLCVVPILMTSMSQAAHDFSTYQAEQQNSKIEEVLCEATNVTFH